MNALGQHLLGDFFGCDIGRLDDAVYLEHMLLQAADELGATVIQATFHHFSPLGVSGVVVIQESHLAIHTWPEGGYAAIDIFTCDPDADPRRVMPTLTQALAAQRSEYQHIPRGRYEDLPPMEELSYPSLSPPLRLQRDHWVTARNEQIALSLRLHGQRLYRVDSARQRIEVYDSQAYGRLLTLDGHIAITERDERIYHEMLVHVPCHLLDQRTHVLLLGGGDGGAVRELLAYPDVGQIDLVEWDPAVPQTVQRYFPELGRGLSNRRVTPHYADASTWLADTPTKPTDLLLVDWPGLMSRIADEDITTLVAQFAEWLAPHGILALAGPSPRQERSAFRQWVGALWNVFGKECVSVGLLNLPTYPGGQMSLLLAARQPLRTESPRMIADLPTFHIYNSGTHQAVFALPNDLKRWLASNFVEGDQV